MSGEALGWAIVQKAGSPSAKSVLIALANYADENWCTCTMQDAIAEFGEQSTDSVGKRLPDLEARRLIRRIPLFFAGRRHMDFVILAPSNFFTAPISHLEPLFPRGCSVDPKYAPADCGNGGGAQSAVTPDSETSTLPQSAVSIPQTAVTLPQSAPDVAAVCPPRCRNLREQDSKKESDDDDSRGANVSREAVELDDELTAIIGRPYANGPDVVQAFLDAEFTREHLIDGTRQCMASKKGGPPNSINYFKQAWSDARARAEQEIDVPTPRKSKTNGARHVRRDEAASVIRELEEESARSDPDGEAPSGRASGPSIERIPIPKLG